MPHLIAAIDQGTTSTRCLLIDHASRVVASAQHPHRQVFPQPGWVEHDPEEIWQQTQRCIVEAMASAKVSPRDLAAVGIANQRETAVMWDARTGRPLAHAIVWQDTRTQTQCTALAAAGGIDRFRPQTGLPLATYFSAAKFRWLLDHLPAGITRQDIRLGTIDAWLISKLTGSLHRTDVTNASRTMLLNLRTLAWDHELCRAFGIDAALLPEIRPSSATNAFGTTRTDGPFAAEIPITGVLGDQQAALLGQTCLAPGQAKNTYGTGCFLLQHTGTEIVPSRFGLLTTVAAQFAGHPPTYALEGSVAIAGALIQWLRDNLKIIPTAPAVEALAATVPDNGGVYFVPAFSGLFAPHWRPDARGAILGMTAYTTAAHIARAALEAAAFQTRDVLDAMAHDTSLALAALRVDGGMSANNLLMQFQADIIGVPVQRAQTLETTALGAAYAAGLAVGFWPDTAALRAAWRSDRQWSPAMTADRRAALLADWRRALDRSMLWAK